MLPTKWSLEIGYEDLYDTEDYWFIVANGERVFGTHTPNETMARRWLSMKYLKLSEEQIDEIIFNAKKERGWIN